MIIHSEQEMLNFGTNFSRNFYTETGGQSPFFEGPKTWASAPERPEKKGFGQDPFPITRIIELIGDVGAGKTTFVRGLAKGLGVKESITSPSFTISKSYPLKNGGSLVHYDFYRLSDPGLMLDDLVENLQNEKNIVVIEWGESINDILPNKRTKIKISYTDTDERNVQIL